MIPAPRVPLSEPPLVPSGDEARSLLRRELLDPDYRQDDVVRRLLEALRRLVTSGLEAASNAPPLSTLAAMVVALLLVVALVWLVSRARRSPGRPTTGGLVVEDHTVSADEWRSLAETALAEGRHDDVVVDGYRAVAVRAVEEGLLDDLPGSTAHEVAVALRSARPDRADDLMTAAGLFDAVLYGHRPATRDQAVAVLRLDDARVVS